MLDSNYAGSIPAPLFFCELLLILGVIVLLNDSQYKCIELMITGEFTQKQIAEKINVTEKTICEWKKLDEFKKEKEKLLRESFSDVAPKVKAELYRLALKAESEQVKLNAIKDILDRAGLKPTDKQEIDLGNKEDKPFKVEIEVLE